MRKVRARFKELGKSLRDRRMVIQVIGELYPGNHKQAAIKAWDRAMPHAPILNRWLGLATWWGSRSRRFNQKCEDVVCDFLMVATPARFDRLGAWFDAFESQWGGNKFKQLSELLRRVRTEPTEFAKPWKRHQPQVILTAIVEAILTLMRANPERFWTPQQLARMLPARLRRSEAIIYYLTHDMEYRGLIKRIDAGRGLLALGQAELPARRSVSEQIIDNLIAGPMRWMAMMRLIGEPIGTQVGMLRRIGVLVDDPNRPSGPSKRAPLELSGYGRDQIARGEIRNRTGRPIWAPADAGQN